MNYVVFDLEWNQCPYGKGAENREIPFEIIEIGAVKLNNEREVLGTFHRLIKPKVYKKLHYRTREIVKMTTKDLENGVPFPDAVKDFLVWTGSDTAFCTWGSVDLTELQRNMRFYGLLGLMKGPFHYYDVQKLFAVEFETMKSRRSLEYGADYLKLEKNKDFHRALSDAWYTAEIFQRIDINVVLAYDSVDTYQNPKSKTDEIHMIYNGYSKYVSREFSNKEVAMKDAEVKASHCCLCGKNCHKKIRWFSASAKNYYCMAVCPVHGYMKGKIRMKHNDDGGLYVVKTIKVSNEREMEMIRAKKDELREKRRKKRHQMSTMS